MRVSVLAGTLWTRAFRLERPLLLPFLKHQMVNLRGVGEIELQVEQPYADRLHRIVDDLEGEPPIRCPRVQVSP